MSIQGKDSRCVVTKADIKNLMKRLNDTTDFKQNGNPVQFGISQQASRCLREYIDLVLFDVANKYVKMKLYDLTTNSCSNKHKKVTEHQQETLILDAIFSTSEHLKSPQSTNRKQPLHACFLDTTTTNNDNKQTQELNPIFLKQ